MIKKSINYFLLFYLFLLFIFSSVAYSQIYVEFLFAIKNDKNISLVTYYFYNNTYIEEIFDKEGKIKICFLNEKNEILKSISLNFSDEEFEKEFFDLKRGKRIIKLDEIFKRIVVEIPEKSEKIKIYFEEKELKEYKIDTNNFRIIDLSEKKVEETDKERNVHKSNNILKREYYIILIFLFLLSLIIILIIIFARKIIKKKTDIKKINFI